MINMELTVIENIWNLHGCHTVCARLDCAGDEPAFKWKSYLHLGVCFQPMESRTNRRGDACFLSRELDSVYQACVCSLRKHYTLWK